VVAATGSYRDAILSVIVLFVSGMVVLAVTDTARAARQAAILPAAPAAALA
jgi:MFS-type transporter involved in bile tolerance (Atg22 family)